MSMVVFEKMVSLNFRRVLFAGLNVRMGKSSLTSVTTPRPERRFRANVEIVATNVKVTVFQKYTGLKPHALELV
jgi:hypothetical protein